MYRYVYYMYVLYVYTICTLKRSLRLAKKGLGELPLRWDKGINIYGYIRLYIYYMYVLYVYIIFRLKEVFTSCL